MNLSLASGRWGERVSQLLRFLTNFWSINMIKKLKISAKYPVSIGKSWGLNVGH